jgi:hypothetical protein
MLAKMIPASRIPREGIAVKRLGSLGQVSTAQWLRRVVLAIVVAIANTTLQVLKETRQHLPAGSPPRQGEDSIMTPLPRILRTTIAVEGQKVFQRGIFLRLFPDGCACYSGGYSKHNKELANRIAGARRIRVATATTNG